MEKLTQAFVINDIVIDPHRNQVQHPGEICTLEPKAMTLLCILAGQPNTVIKQESLFDAIWPGRVFSPSSLQRLIALVRKALRDSAKSPQLIFTHAKQGYSLEATISRSKPRSEKTRKLLIPALSMIVLAIVFIAYNYFRPSTALTSTVPFTFTSLTEFNGQFAPDGKAIAFLRHSADKQTELVVRQEGKSDLSLRVENAQIRNFTWLTNQQLLVAVKDPAGVKLHRYKLTSSGIQAQQSLPVPKHLRDIKHLFRGPGSSVYFVSYQSSQAQDQTSLRHSAIMQLDLISFEHKTLINLPDTQDIIDLAATPDGLYVSLFVNKKSNKLLRIEPDSQTVTMINAELGGRYKLAWSDYIDRLIVLDSLKPGVFTLDSHNQLVPFQHDLTAGVTDADLYQNKLLTSQAHQTINVFSSQDSGTALIDSKYEDYLASVSPNGRSMAFVSNRSGYPQLYLSEHGKQPEVIFTNPGQEDFISRAIWHRAAQHLVFAADQKVYRFDVATHQLIELPITQPIARVEYWHTSELSGQDVLYLAHAGQANIVKYHIGSGKAELLSGSEHLIYASETHRVDWQDNTLITSAGLSWQPDTGKIRNAFSVDERILVQIGTQDAQRLLEFDRNLTLLSERPLPESAQFVTSAFYTEQNALTYYYSHWQNSDSDLMLSQIAH
ncbi:winged helix-turn-helix domain-containing protein [Pseudoalteromonas rubra]|uniref:OmpR/PhoB-type domain-containing protein n=1 Tax=Pseudoalteromonas rubra TaxID=43658 RepID=A0A0U3GYJ7_9GAMM|nr:winged helix-turn-helix domain-containing protein [Pseudoalteromonas rubra]ALU45406.1 hypothetical protein AT705_20890 [Pseudoalteromonas rubra]